jgi:predicted ATP-dependent endonuclease of OLD family
MKIVAVDIDRFRGIQHLRLKTDAFFVCLVGPGDSTKTTILRAIELTLTSQRNIVFYDTDFFDADVRQPIRIEVTLTGLPSELITERKFGRWIKGYTSGHIIRDEPQGNDAEALTIRLEVDDSLEPQWLVVNERLPEGVRISSYDRARIGVSRIGDYSDWQLGWSQGSILSRLMDEQENVHSVLALARIMQPMLADVA